MSTLEQSLTAAIRSQDHASLRELIKLPGAATVKNVVGRTPLHTAAEECDLEAATTLLEAGYEVNARTNTGTTPLHVAATYGRMPAADWDPEGRLTFVPAPRSVPMRPELVSAIVAILREKAPTLLDDIGVTNLHADDVNADLIWKHSIWIPRSLQLESELAARGIELGHEDPELAEILRGQPNVLRLAQTLIDHGADTDQFDDDGYTPLRRAVECGKLEMVELLLKNHANPNLSSDSHRNNDHLFTIALENNSVAIADKLVEYGTLLEFKDSRVLHSSAFAGKVEAVTWLLDHGADINMRDHTLATPLMSAASNDAHEVISILIRKGADTKAKDIHGNSALHLAAGWPNCVALLIESGSPVEDRNTEGRTPLHSAAQSRDPVSIADLLAAGACPNATDQSGDTPLHVIFFSDELRPDIEFPTFHSLVSAGTKRATRNLRGETPYDMALKRQYPDEYLDLLNPSEEKLRDPTSFIYLGSAECQSFLPNALVPTRIDGEIWPSAAHWFHAQKTADTSVREAIRKTKTEEDARSILGELVKDRLIHWPHLSDEKNAQGVVDQIQTTQFFTRSIACNRRSDPGFRFKLGRPLD